MATTKIEAAGAVVAGAAIGAMAGGPPGALIGGAAGLFVDWWRSRKPKPISTVTPSGGTPPIKGKVVLKSIVARGTPGAPSVKMAAKPHVPYVPPPLPPKPTAPPPAVIRAAAQSVLGQLPTTFSNDIMSGLYHQIAVAALNDLINTPTTDNLAREIAQLNKSPAPEAQAAAAKLTEITSPDASAYWPQVMQ